eukprot:2085227-Amphidinium_carterae.1
MQRDKRCDCWSAFLTRHLLNHLIKQLAFQSQPAQGIRCLKGPAAHYGRLSTVGKGPCSNFQAAW